MRSVAAVPLACLVAVGLAACGGSGDAKLSRAEVVKKADAICAQADAASAKVTQPKDPNDLGQASGYFGDLIPGATKERDALRALQPADDAKGDLGALTGAIDRAVGDLETLRDKAKAKDAAAVQQQLQMLSTRATDIGRAATALGAKRCAGGGAGG